MKMSHEKPILTKFLPRFLKAYFIEKGILYRARLIIPRKQLNKLYFLFVHSYLNYANLEPQGSTRKTKLYTLSQ